MCIAKEQTASGKRSVLWPSAELHHMAIFPFQGSH
jgi:hypothetical protein